jgi:hypothetical protein
MNILIKTANIGKIDHPQQIIAQLVKHEHIVFDQAIPGMSNRLSARKLKTTCTQGYDLVIWLDHRVHVISPKFVQFVIDKMQGIDFLVSKHPDRKTLIEEYTYIMQNIESPYLKERYGNDDWASEMYAYKNSNDATLVNTRFFAYRPNKKTVQTLMKKWWQEIQKYTLLDQSQLTHLLHIAPKTLKYSLVTWVELNQHLKVFKHK